MSVDRAVELQQRSWTLQSEGRFDEARLVCREAIDLLMETEGPDSPDVANLLNDLAEIEQDGQRLSDALATAELARSIEEKLGGRFTGETAARVRGRTLAVAGAIRRVQGDYAGAERDLGAATALAIAEFGETSAEAAEAQNNLAVLYKYWGRFDEGLRLYALALSSYVAVHGEESLECATIYHNIGGILHARGDCAAAEAPARKAWDISRRLLGEEDARSMIDAVAYAGVLDGLGRFEESVSIYSRALRIFEDAFGPDHEEVAAVLHNLAACRAARGGHEEAEASYRRALAIHEQALGADSPSVALTCNNLGRLLIDLGRSAEAAPLLARALSTLSRLPEGHPHLEAARENFRRLGLEERRGDGRGW